MNPKPKVLLIFPGNSKWGFTYPLGLLYVADVLIKMGIDVKLLNLGIDNTGNIVKDKYLFVGITMLTGNMISDGLEVAKMVKAYDNSIPIVLGGVHPSVLPEQSLESKLADIVVIGEGEVTVKELTERLIAGRSLEGVKGTAYKDKDGKIIVNEPREFIDLNTTSIELPYHLLGDKFTKSSTIPVHTSRGCPFRCSFCYSTYFNRRKYRTKTAERVVDEIEYLYKKYGFRNFNFDFEDEFFIDPKRVCDIFEGVMKRGLEIHWTSFCRFDTFAKTYEKLGDSFPELLKKSGCYFIGFGGESGSQRMLDEVIRKDITVEQIRKTAEVLKKHEIAHRVTFINGFPDETKEDIEATFSVVEKICEGNDYIFVGLINLIPYPGTPVFDLLVKERGYKPPLTLEEWGKHVTPITYERMTWLPKEYARYCYDSFRVGAGAFYRDFKSYKEFERVNYNTDMPFAPNYIGYIICKIERWRHKRRNYKFMFEVTLAVAVVGRFYKLRAYVVNFILKKYLSENTFKSLKRMLGDKSWSFKKK